MQGLIPESTLTEIQQKVDLVELISSYVPLKAAGRNFRALCPFHSEKTPSFMVHPEKGIFHCFGCGAGGNIFGFLMKIENITFPEAVENLAQKAGVAIERTQTEASRDFEKKALFEFTEKVARFFEYTLRKHPEAREATNYLKARGVDPKTIDFFRLGYCSFNEMDVLRELKLLKMDERVLEKIGVVTAPDQGSHLRFKGRIIFPISDSQGRIVGFGGRALGDRMPKYLNSPETVLFNKSQTLYGLNFAKKAILQKTQSILTEGYLDVISVFKAGLENVVATMGTAFNENHVRLLRRFSQEVVVAYDGDEAGLEASLRAMEIFLDQDVIVRIARIPGGHDPDSFIRKEGKNAFEKIIQGAPSMIDFKLDLMLKRVSGRGEKEKLMISREMLKTVGRLKSPVLKDHYLKSLSQSLGVSENAMREELKSVIMTKNIKGPVGSETGQNESIPIPIIEGDILRILLKEKGLIEYIKGKIDPEQFESKECKSLLETMIKNNGNFSANSEHDLQTLYSRLTLEGHLFKNSKETLDLYITTLKIIGYDKEYSRLTQELKEVEKTGNDPNKINAMLAKMQNVKKEIAILKKR